MAEVKGRPEMADVLAAAVKDRQHVPDGALVLQLDGERVRIPAAAIRRARDRGPAHPPPAQRGPAGLRRAVRRASVAAEYAADLGERSGAGARRWPASPRELDLDLLVAELRRQRRGAATRWTSSGRA